MKKNKKGFTLAETLIALVILGVVAAITIPALINKYIESANRTKVKKAMAAYEKALNQMIIDNDVKGAVGAALNTTNCTITTEYFKKIAGSGCRFQTADKVWWDISDIEHPIISLKDQITTSEESAMIKSKADNISKDKTSLVMVGEIKEGIVRINDKTTAKGIDKKYLTKLWDVFNDTDSRSDFEKNCVVDLNDPSKCTITYNCPTTEEPNKICTQSYEDAEIEDTDAYSCAGRYNGKCTGFYGTYHIDASNLHIAEIILNESDATSIENCNSSIFQYYLKGITPTKVDFCLTQGDYWTLAKKSCEMQNAHLAKPAEIQALNDAGKLNSSDFYWTDELYPFTYRGVNMYCPKYYDPNYYDIDGLPIGIIHYGTKTMTESSYKAICVAN